MSAAANDSYDFLFKVIIIGDSGVGKSSILTRYTRNEFGLETKSTIGVELATSLMTVDEKTIKCAIWDTAGQERFRAATNLYYRNTMGAFVVYDITNYNSFQNVSKWIKEIGDHVSGRVLLTLVGNKSDLRHLRSVSQEEAQAFADQNGMSYIETSALEAQNIQQAFQNLVSEIYYQVYKIKESSEQRDIFETSGNRKTVNLIVSSSDSASKENKIQCC